MFWKPALFIAMYAALGLLAAPVAAQQLPPAPAPVAVTLDPASTAVIVLDITTQTCSPQANCLEMLPRVASLLASARAAYTVVVDDDGTAAAQDYDVAVGRYQLLTQLSANPNNEALRKSAVTLSKTDLISFQ